MDKANSLSGEHVASYKQYKDDTDAIAGWLAQNALKCGYKIPTTAPTNENVTAAQAPSTRLKGKARKQAREQSKPTQAKTPTGPKYTINVSDFGAMAKTIADFKPKLTIPKALANLFSRAIDARKACTQWYESNFHGGEDSNKRHAHFTNVLNSAWEILRPFQETRTSHVKKPTPEASDAAKVPPPGLVNRFSSLNVERSPEQDPETGPQDSVGQDVNDYKLTDVAPVILVKSEEDLEDDFFFAIFAFMQELRELRSLVRVAWQGYREGMTELISCSLITNTAIQLARRAEHELDLTVERPKKYPASSYPVWTFPGIFMYETHEKTMKEKNVDLDTFVKPSPASHNISCSHSVLCLWETITSLKHSLYEWASRGKNYMLPGVTDYAGSPNIPENFGRIKRMLPCFQAVARSMADAFASDEVTLGIGVMFDTTTVPIWVAFAIQLLLDIQDELRPVPDKPRQEVQQHTRNKLSAFRRRKFDQEPFTQVGEGTKWLSSVLNGFELDVLGDNFRKTATGGGMLDPRTGKKIRPNLDELRDLPGLPDFIKEPDYFLRINPIKCGMLKYGVYLQTHYYAVNFEQNWRGLTSMAHLYIACRILFPDDPVWPDMEYLLHYQDLGNIFLGGLPVSMEEARKKFLLAAGMTATNFARNRRSTKLQLHMDKGRWISNPSLLDSIYSHWMCGGTFMSDNMVIGLVRSLGDPKNIAQKIRQGMLPADMGAEFTKSWSKPDRPMTTTLKALLYFIQTETGDLYFDWLSFAETCQRIWNEIFTFFDEYDDQSKTRAPHTTAIEILDEACKCQWIAEEDKQDVPSFLREHATGVVKSWEIIQKLNRKGMKVSFGASQGAYYNSSKAWVGDKELFGVMSKSLGEAPYPNVSKSLADKIYKNWPEQDVVQSAVYRMNTPPPPPPPPPTPRRV